MTTVEARVVHHVHPGLRIDVDLVLRPGCSTLFGPSGAGKTTLLRLISGLIRPDSGSIRVGDETWFDPTTNRPLRSRDVGMIFQDDRLFPHLGVAANIGFGLHRLPRPEADRRVAEVAAICGVSHLLGRSPQALSGGERQRVGLARALAPRPKLLLADEPVSSLDADARFGLIDRLRRIAESESLPTLVVTHSPAEAIALGGPLSRMAGGTIVDRGHPLDVLARSPGDSSRIDGTRNILRGTIARHAPGPGETIVSLLDGPELVIPSTDRPVGSAVSVMIRADEIVLARGEIGAVSARNLIAGTVDRWVVHPAGAEVRIRSGKTEWTASVVGSAVAGLDLHPGIEVRMILKARSIRLLDDHTS